MRLHLTACASLLVLGCGDSTPATGNNDLSSAKDLTVATGGDMAGAPGGDMAGPTIKVSGVVSDYQTKMGVSGLMVCLYYPMLMPQPCATTGMDGSYTVSGLPTNTNVIASLTGGGYFPALYGATTGAIDGNFNLTGIKAGAVTLLAAAVGQQVDDTKGQFAIGVLDGNPPTDGGTPDGGMASPVAGVTVTIAPASGMGPYYFDDSGIPQATNKQMATSSKGAAAMLNVDPGDYEFTFTAPNGVTCGPPLGGWPGSKPNSVKMRAVAGYGSGVAITCK